MLACSFEPLLQDFIRHGCVVITVSGGTGAGVGVPRYPSACAPAPAPDAGGVAKQQLAALQHIRVAVAAGRLVVDGAHCAPVGLMWNAGVLLHFRSRSCRLRGQQGRGRRRGASNCPRGRPSICLCGGAGGLVARRRRCNPAGPLLLLLGCVGERARGCSCASVRACVRACVVRPRPRARACGHGRDVGARRA